MVSDDDMKKNVALPDPDEFGDDPMANMDEPAMDPLSDLQDEQMDAAEEFGEDGDFVEEDWESYDDEEYLDDSDTAGVDEAKAARSAAFNKIIIGIAVVIALGVGGMTMFKGQDTSLGLPKMKEVAKAPEVTQGEKVEFHAETKVQPTNAFGVTYGQEVIQEEPQEEKKEAPAGILNDPSRIKELREKELGQNDKAPKVAYQNDSSVLYRTKPVEVDSQPPMPLPIAQVEHDSGDKGGSPGLIPMPKTASTSQNDPGTLPTRLPTAGDVKRPQAAMMTGHADSDSSQQVSAATAADTGTPQLQDSAAPAARSPFDDTPASQSAAAASAPMGDTAAQKLDQVLARLDSLQDSVDALESRVNKIEKHPVAAKSRSSISHRTVRSAVSSAPARKASPEKVVADWILKSAQPGEAMVSRKGESDMTRIAVGQSLAGIGKITGISMENGRWIVQGTNGRVVQ